jgi:hypothetical protein
MDANVVDRVKQKYPSWATTNNVHNYRKAGRSASLGRLFSSLVVLFSNAHWVPWSRTQGKGRKGYQCVASVNRKADVQQQILRPNVFHDYYLFVCLIQLLIVDARGGERDVG